LQKAGLDGSEQIAYATLLINSGYSSPLLLSHLDKALKETGNTTPAHIQTVLKVVSTLGGDVSSIGAKMQVMTTSIADKPKTVVIISILSMKHI
jgi:hypothetical protein